MPHSIIFLLYRFNFPAVRERILLYFKRLISYILYLPTVGEGLKYVERHNYIFWLHEKTSH